MTLKEITAKETAELHKECGVFFAFNREQLTEGIEKNRHLLKEGEKFCALGQAGIYLIKQKIDRFLDGSEKIRKAGLKKLRKMNLDHNKQILNALQNFETFISEDFEEVFNHLNKNGVKCTYNQIYKVFTKNQNKQIF